ncbi:unnamed protein product, partial [Mesorhabditis spiculigera]
MNETMLLFTKFTTKWANSWRWWAIVIVYSVTVRPHVDYLRFQDETPKAVLRAAERGRVLEGDVLPTHEMMMASCDTSKEHANRLIKIIDKLRSTLVSYNEKVDLSVQKTRQVEQEAVEAEIELNRAKKALKLRKGQRWLDRLPPFQRAVSPVSPISPRPGHNAGQPDEDVLADVPAARAAPRAQAQPPARRSPAAQEVPNGEVVGAHAEAAHRGRNDEAFQPRVIQLIPNADNQHRRPPDRDAVEAPANGEDDQADVRFGRQVQPVELAQILQQPRHDVHAGAHHDAQADQPNPNVQADPPDAQPERRRRRRAQGTKVAPPAYQNSKPKRRHIKAH